MEGHEHASPIGLVPDPLAEKPAENFLESSSKFSGKHCVDERVDGGVAVTQPEDDGEDEGRDAVFAERRHQVHREKGEPTQDEAADDDAKCFGSFGLHSKSPDLILDVSSAESFVVILFGHRTCPCCNRQVGSVVDDAADHGRDAAHVPKLVGRARQRHVEQGRSFKIDASRSAPY